MSEPEPFDYVYILENHSVRDRYYVGFTTNLRERIVKHNSGDVPHTCKYRPWRLKTAVAFTDQQRALQFEKYLKTGSGRAFAKKRL